MKWLEFLAMGESQLHCATFHLQPDATGSRVARNSSMRPLSSTDVEAELSYAYLHAVAGQAGVGCRYACRHEDGRGIDAQLTAWGSWPDSYRTEINLNVQLKATTKKLADDGLQLSYFLKESKTSTHYDDLRCKTVDIPRILVVLCLPEDSTA